MKPDTQNKPVMTPDEFRQVIWQGLLSEACSRYATLHADWEKRGAELFQWKDMTKINAEDRKNMDNAWMNGYHEYEMKIRQLEQKLERAQAVVDMAKQAYKHDAIAEWFDEDADGLKEAIAEFEKEAFSYVEDAITYYSAYPDFTPELTKARDWLAKVKALGS